MATDIELKTTRRPRYYSFQIQPDWSAAYASASVTLCEFASSHQSENAVWIDFVGSLNTPEMCDLAVFDDMHLNLDGATEANNSSIAIWLPDLSPDIGSPSDFLPAGALAWELHSGNSNGRSSENGLTSTNQHVELSASISHPLFSSVSAGQNVESFPASTNVGHVVSTAPPNISIASADVTPNVSSGSPIGALFSATAFGLHSVPANFTVANSSMESISATQGAQTTTQVVTLAGSELKFVNTYDSDVSSSYISAIIAAENFYQEHFSNNVTIDITFGMATGGFVAQSNAARDTTLVSYSELVTLLTTHETTADNVAAVNSLSGVVDPTNGTGFILTSALAEALGLSSFTSSSNTNTVNLNSGDSYFYNGVAVSGEFDARGALEHEISEIMGRIGGLGLDLGSGIYSDYWGPIDLFRYSAAGQRDYSGGADGKLAFFSINGTTLLTEFNNPVTNDPSNPAQGGDVADWNAAGHNAGQVAVQVSGGYDSYGATPTGEVGVVTSTDLEVMNILGWTPTGAANLTPQVIVNVQNVSVAENTAIAASSLITSVTNPNGDNITEYGFWDGGTGNGHFTVNGTTQLDGQWIYVPASNLSGIKYVGGPQPGNEPLYVVAYDATTGIWSNYSSLTATTTAPPLQSIVVNVQSVSVAENASIPASSLITSISNPSGDSIADYAFWDGGTGNGHFTVNGTIQPDGQWIVVNASNLSSIQYVGGASPGSEQLFVEVYDATTGTWSNYSSLTATTTAPHITVSVQNVLVAENTSIPASSLITSISNPSGDIIADYAFWDGGTGNGHFTVNGTIQPDGQWIVVNASNLSGIQYVGGASPGNEQLFVDIYDATTGTWSNYSSLTATTTTPHAPANVNVHNVSVAENAPIAASSLITSVSNPSGDSITYYAFWDAGTGNGYFGDAMPGNGQSSDAGTGNGHFTVNGVIQPDGQWIVVSASNFGSVEYVGGASPGSEALFVTVYDATTGAWSNTTSLTAFTTPFSPAQIQSDYLAITRMALSLADATAEIDAIAVGTTTETQYINSLLSQVVDTTIPVVAVEGSMYGAVGSSAVITNLVTNFLPGQLAYAMQVGLDPQTFACLETALVFAFANESGSTAFANNFGPSNTAMPATAAGDTAFAAAATNAIFGSAQTANTAPAILGYVHFLEGFFTANGIVGVQNPTADQIVIAARAGAWGEGIAIAEGNNLGLFPGQTTNFLEDAAQGTAIYSAPFSSQPTAAPFQEAATALVVSTAIPVQVTGVAAPVDHAVM